MVEWLSNRLSFLSLGRLYSLPCHNEGAEINTVVYLRGGTRGQVHEATQAWRAQPTKTMVQSVALRTTQLTDSVWPSWTCAYPWEANIPDFSPVPHFLTLKRLKSELVPYPDL